MHCRCLLAHCIRFVQYRADSLRFRLVGAVRPCVDRLRNHCHLLLSRLGGTHRFVILSYDYANIRLLLTALGLTLTPWVMWSIAICLRLMGKTDANMGMLSTTRGRFEIPRATHTPHATRKIARHTTYLSAGVLGIPLWVGEPIILIGLVIGACVFDKELLHMMSTSNTRICTHTLPADTDLVYTHGVLYLLAPGIPGLVFLILVCVRVDGGLLHVAWYLSTPTRACTHAHTSNLASRSPLAHAHPRTHAHMLVRTSRAHACVLLASVPHSAHANLPHT